MASRAAAALRTWSRAPVAQDLALVALLAVATATVNRPNGMLRMIAGLGPLDRSWPGVLLMWWSATGVALAAVALRRRWPMPALVASAAGTLVHMALPAGPVLADLAAPIVLCTVATKYRRQVSLAVLAASFLVAAGWSTFTMLEVQGRPPTMPDGPSVQSRQQVDAVGGSGFDPLGLDGSIRMIRLTNPPAPTDWGGAPILGSFLLAGWGIGSSARSRRAYLDELTIRARDLAHERNQQAALAAAAERSRITRELHDVVAHGLSVMVVQAQGAAAALDSRPADTKTALSAIVETGRSSLADMRRALGTVGSVDGAWQPQPGLDRLAQLVEQVRQAGTPVELQVEGTPGARPAAVDLSAYRIAQEALTNTMKHAGPGARAWLLLTYDKDFVHVEVRDDGSPGSGTPGSGNGLRGMRERAALLGGELSAGPGPAGGFVVRARLPITRADG